MKIKSKYITQTYNLTEWTSESLKPTTRLKIENINHMVIHQSFYKKITE